MAQPAAFFDLDKTIIAKSSTLAFGRPLFQAGFLDRRDLVKAAIAQIWYKAFGADHEQMEKMRESLMDLTAGWHSEEIEELVTETMGEIIEPLVFHEAVMLIEEHQGKGDRVFIVSSSPIEVVGPLASFLGVQDVIATRSTVGPDGKYTGELEFYSYKEHKATAIRELADTDGLDLAASHAYSDSVTDLPMLEVVGHPVAVNPDRELKDIATERNWTILEFERPVELTQRLADSTEAKVGGAALVGLAGAAAVWWATKKTRR